MKLSNVFRGLDRYQAPPELWRMVEDRAAMPEGGFDEPTTRLRRARSRIIAVAVAGVLSALSLVLVFIAFRPSSAPAPAIGDVPLEVVLSCDGSGTHVEATEVQAQRDGVHLVVRNLLGTDPGLSVRFDGRGSGYNLAPQGVTRLTVSMPPGEFRVACGVLDSETVTTAPLVNVVDPERFYIPVSLECPGDATASFGTGIAAGADPLDVATTVLEPFMDSGDTVEVAGYPAAEPRIVRMVRGESVVAMVTLVRQVDGTWRSDAVTGCASLLPA